MITFNLLFMILHIIGVALGVGGATMSDALFVTSIGDYRIDRSELKLLKIASKIVMVGLILLNISGIGFVLTGSVLAERFWAKLTIVFIAALNGYAMHNFLFPIFERFERDRVHLLSAEVRPHIPIIVTAGTISAISWYAALILGAWRTLTLGYWQIIGVYGAIIAVGVIGANLGIRWLLGDPARVNALSQRVSNALSFIGD